MQVKAEYQGNLCSVCGYNKGKVSESRFLCFVQLVYSSINTL